ncbi:MAG: PAS domain S-box protein [Blastocatellia bacterium]|nr:PAS domain S-box protein [Blastocatellia bacterium]
MMKPSTQNPLFDRPLRRQVWVGFWGVIFSVTVFTLAQYLARWSFQKELHRQSEEQVLFLREDIRLTQADLQTLAAFPEVTGGWNEKQFHRLAQHLLEENTGFQRLEWHPLVLKAERSIHEQKMQADGFPGYRIREPDATGKPIVAGTRAEYFPLQFVEPATYSQELLGLDFGFDSTGKGLLEEAKKGDFTIISGVVPLLPAASQKKGLVFVVPVFQTDLSGNQEQPSHQALLGFCLAVTEPSLLIKNSLHPFEQAGLELNLFDESSQGKWLAAYPAATQSNQVSSPPQEASFYALTYHLPVGNRKWLAVVSPGPAFVSRHSAVWPIFLLVVGFGVTLAGLAFLQNIEQRERVLTAKVTQRTKKLAQANASLTQSELSLAATLQSIAEAVVTFDIQGKITQFNQVAARLTDWTPAEAIGQKFETVVVLVDETTLQPLTLLADRVPAAKIAKTHEAPLLVTKTGSTWPISYSLAPIQGPGQTILGTVLVFRDVAQERQDRQRLHELNVALERQITGRTAELRQRNLWLRAIFENEPECVKVVSLDGTLLEMNPAGFKLLEADPSASLRGNSVFDLVHPLDRAAFQQLHLDSIEGKPGQLQYRITTLKGTERWVESYSTPLRDAENVITSILSVTRDITERKLRERLQIWENSILEAISEGLPLSELLVKITLGVEDLIPHCISSILLVDEKDRNHLRHGAGPHLPQAYVQAIDGITVGPQAGSCGTAVHRKEPVFVTDIQTDPLWTDFRDLANQFGLAACWSLPILDLQQEVLATFALYYREPKSPSIQDIELINRTVNVVRIALEHDRKNRELRLLSACVARLKDIILITEAEPFEEPGPRILFVNDAFERITGYSRAEALGRNPRFLQGPKTQRQELDRIRAAVLNQQPVSCELINYKKTGEEFWVEMDIVPLADTQGHVTHLVSIERDITERKGQEEALRQREAMLQIASKIGKLGAWSVEPPWGEVEWSEQIRTIFDLNPGSKPTVDEFLVFFGSDGARLKSTLENCYRLGTPIEEESQICTLQGRLAWVRIIAEAVKDEKGEIIKVHGALQDITDRKEAETTLAASEARFHELAESMPMFVWTTTPEGKVDFINHVFSEYTGVSQAEPDLIIWSNLAHPDDLPHIRDLCIPWAKSGKHSEMEVRIRSGGNGTYRWFQIQMQPIFDPNDKLVKCYATGIDIHNTKRLEEEATALANRLQATLESIADGFFTLDRDWRFTYVNSKAETLTQIPRKEMLGQSKWELFPESPDSESFDLYHQAMKTGEPVSFERFYEPLGKWFGVDVYPSPDGLTTFFRDITQERQNREQLRLLEAAVTRLNDIVMITEAEPVSEPGPKILFVNDAFEKITGYSREEVLGKSPRILQGPKTQREELDRVRQALKTWQPVRAQLMNYKKSGEEFWIELDIVPLADAKGWFTHWVAIERDITERKNLEAQLFQSQKMEAIGQLAAGVAHDFNNLLMVISGYSDTLLQKLPPNDLKRKMVANIRDAGQRAANLTRQLLAFSRKQALSPQVLDLNQVVGNVEKLLRRLIGEDVLLVTVLQPNLQHIKVDPGQIEQVIINLAVNARDAMPRGGMLTIETENLEIKPENRLRPLVGKPGAYVSLTLSDTGIGMPPEVKAHIFEPFFTTKEPGKGTGLGLATVFGIVQQSGGQIEVWSEVGEGTRFTLLFPAIVENKPIEPSSKISTPVGKETILVVEDEPTVREIIKISLEEHGYQVLEAQNGQEALTLLVASPHPIDLLVTDVVMPVMSGRELVEQLPPAHKHLKVLFMSGYTDDAVVRHGIREASSYFLQKPFAPEELAGKVREILDVQEK